MIAIISLLLVLTLSFLITRLATAALSLTGVSEDLARLQAVSAFTGVGFTTNESEHIVQHPVRRRILIALMVLGNAGIVTAMSSFILSFTGIQQSGETFMRIGFLIVGMVVLVLVASSSRIDHWMSQVMRWALRRWTRLEARDYADLLKLQEDYSVRLITVEEDDWIAGKTLEDADLYHEGISVLGIKRTDGDYIGVPRGESKIHPGDTLTLYGRESRIRKLDERRRGAEGEQAHERAKEGQEQERADQNRRDAERKRERESPDSESEQRRFEQREEREQRRAEAEQAGEESEET